MTINPPSTAAAAPSLQDLAVIAAQVADDKKGLDTVILDVGDALAITEYFVITSATNRRQVAMIADEVEQAVKAASGRGPLSIEGLGEGSWVLLDFGGFVCHVFNDETRRFYDLERLWREVPRVTFEPLRGPGSAESTDADDDDLDDDAGVAGSWSRAR